MRRRHPLSLLLLIAVVGAGCLPAPTTATNAVAGSTASSGPTTLVPTDDAWVSPQMPSRNTGADTVTRALTGTRERTTWVRFEVPKAPYDGATVASAVLTVPVRLGAGDVRVDVAESGWSERTINARNVPRIDRTVGHGTTAGSSLQVDLTAAKVVWPGQAKTFVLRSKATDREIVFRSKESGAGATLRVEWSKPTTTTTAAPAPTTTAAPAPVPAPATEESFGMNVRWKSGYSYEQLLAEAEAKYGRFDVVRIFHSGLPKGWDGIYGRMTNDQVISFKANPIEVLAGTHDSYLRNWFATAPHDRTIYWSYFHEPEDDIQQGSFTAADYRAAWRRINALAEQAGHPDLHATLILMWWTGRSASGRNVDDYWPGNDVIDVLAWDSYNQGAYNGGTTYNSPAHMFDDLLAHARAKGKPVAFAEFGSVLASGDDGRARAAWLHETARYFRTNGVEFVTYWNDADGNLDFQLHDAYGTEAWKQIMAG